VRRTFTIKGNVFKFSEDDVKRAAATMNSGTRDRVRFYAKVEGEPYPVRQLLVNMVRRKGLTVPDVTTHEAVRVQRALGFEIIEV
jgi:hypothetical protein